MIISILQAFVIFQKNAPGKRKTWQELRLKEKQYMRFGFIYDGTVLYKILQTDAETAGGKVKEELFRRRLSQR